MKTRKRKQQLEKKNRSARSSGPKTKIENCKNSGKSRAATGEIRKDRGHCHKTQRSFLLPQSQ